MDNYESKVKIVKTLALQGFDILEIEIQGTIFWYLSKAFEKSSMGAIQNSPFLSITGKDITDFIQNFILNTNIAVLSDKIRQIDETEKNMVMQFSDKHIWRFYTKPY
jgi:hypothetical protein